MKGKSAHSTDLDAIASGNAKEILKMDSITWFISTVDFYLRSTVLIYYLDIYYPPHNSLKK